MVRKPIDVPTRETAAFMTAHLPPGATVLEVGCGDGRVAAELLRRGYGVIGVDSEPEAVARARSRGVPVLQASWPAYEGPRVDAVAFIRSLHHIRPLDQAVAKARAVLGGEGALLVEDFAFDEADERTIAWFLDVLRATDAQALIAPVPHAFVTDLLAAPEPAGAWHRTHDHDLHTMTAMTLAVSTHFAVRDATAVPYLYRYLVPVLPETIEAVAFMESVLHDEAHRAARGEIALIGRRMMAGLR
jgi:SAM-dependent methyltransferase